MITQEQNDINVRRVAEALNKSIIEAARKPMEPLKVGDEFLSNFNGIEIKTKITEINGDEATVIQSFIPSVPVKKVYFSSKFKPHLIMGINRYKIIFAIRKNGTKPIVFGNSRKNYRIPVIKKKRK